MPLDFYEKIHPILSTQVGNGTSGSEIFSAIADENVSEKDASQYTTFEFDIFFILYNERTKCEIKQNIKYTCN